MAFNLKLPSFLSGSKPASDQTVSAPTVMDAGQPAPAPASGGSTTPSSGTERSTWATKVLEFGPGQMR